MAASPGGNSHRDSVAELRAALTVALAAGTREAFASLLTEDVRWGGERRGADNECTTREQAGDHYASLIEAGVTLRIADLQPAFGTAGSGTAGDGEVATVLTARVQISSPDPDDFPPEMAARLSLHDGLIADICILDTPSGVEVLYFEGCPHFETFLPHLRDLLAEHGITAPVTLTRIEDDVSAQAHQFLGSPSVRVDGHDVEPGVDDHHNGEYSEDGDGRRDDAEHGGGRFGMQCRLYPTPDGVAGTPQDQWILDALT